MLLNVETRNPILFKQEAQRIRGKVIAVTGDAGGMGGVTAIRLAGEGARVFLAARSHEELEGVLSVIRRDGGQADGLVVDFRRPGDVQRFFRAACRWEPFHALVNFLALEPPLFIRQDELEICAYDCLRHAVFCLQGVPESQVIHVSGGNISAAGRTLAAGLRQEAVQRLVRMTIIEAGDIMNDSAAEAVADCVVSSLMEPFHIDKVFLKEPKEPWNM